MTDETHTHVVTVNAELHCTPKNEPQEWADNVGHAVADFLSDVPVKVTTEIEETEG